MTIADPHAVYVVIVAAGRGTRVGGSTPKQYRSVAGRAVINRSVSAFQACPQVQDIAVVIAAGQESQCEAALAGCAPVRLVTGGADRQASVRAGLACFDDIATDQDVVLIHDAARPFVSAAIIDSVIAAVVSHGAAIPAIAVTDTLKSVNGAGEITGTLSRDVLRSAQTPQGFRFGELRQAHLGASADAALTDDAGLIEALGGTVFVVTGDPENVKLTTEFDFQQAELRMSMAMETRTGSGFDVHRFGPGSSVWLCGLEIPHSHALRGHSDADVGLHALTDALLGAISEGDIGDHFPPSDPKWRGAASAQFLRHATDLVARRHGRIVNVDVTVICEAPKIGPHRAAMQSRIAEILKVSASRVSVKATTTEKLGFTGRGEGIACQAIATVLLPQDETEEDAE